MLETVKEIVAEELERDINTLSSESNFSKDLGADSLDVVELVMTLEEKLDFEIPDEEAEKMKTIGDVVTYIKERQ
jgi:acyl carrier protein